MDYDHGSSSHQLQALGKAGAADEREGQADNECHRMHAIGSSSYWEDLPQGSTGREEAKRKAS